MDSPLRMLSRLGGVNLGELPCGLGGTRLERFVLPLIGVMRYPEFRRAASNCRPDVRGACIPPRVVSRVRNIATHCSNIAQYCTQYCIAILHNIARNTALQYCNIVCIIVHFDGTTTHCTVRCQYCRQYWQYCCFAFPRLELGFSGMGVAPLTT